MKEEKFVLDTSLFLANQVRDDGDSLEDAVNRLLDQMQASEIDFYMPASTFSELAEIMDYSVEKDTVDRLREVIVRKSPSPPKREFFSPPTFSAE